MVPRQLASQLACVLAQVQGLTQELGWALQACPVLAVVQDLLAAPLTVSDTHLACLLQSTSLDW